MRKLIESTLVSLDGVIEAPERWANFDTEATVLSLEQLGNYDAFVMRLKDQPGKDLIKYGTSRFDDTLLRDHLIDEFRFWIMPVVAGRGQRLFEDVDTSVLDLRLTDQRRLENGSVILTYTPN